MIDDTTTIIAGIIGLIFLYLIYQIYILVKKIARGKTHGDYINEYHQHCIFGDDAKAIESLKNAFWQEFNDYDNNPLRSSKKWDEEILIYEKAFRSFGIDIDLKTRIANRRMR